LGIGDWGCENGPIAQFPIPNPQSPVENFSIFIFIFIKK